MKVYFGVLFGASRWLIDKNVFTEFQGRVIIGTWVLESGFELGAQITQLLHPAFKENKDLWLSNGLLTINSSPP